ncbi:hypothetical protein ACTML9_07325 [Porphyromonas levii]|uniref:hypothetical protein n=1 Tax=Porphyromonas levii TaxID=28114 RepID=UPI0010712A19|nr:hypothetical protein [Porphyromonas levii]TFH94704.1 hypothetical protein E4P48_09835 [Porphyromonas levii]
MIQNKFIEGDSTYVCEEIDHEIMSYDPKRIADLSLETGFVGLLRYVTYHLQGALIQGNKTPFDACYLSDISHKCRCVLDECKSENNFLHELIKYYFRIINNKLASNVQPDLMSLVSVHKIDDNIELCSTQIGLNNGLCGILLNSLEENSIL